MLVRRPRPALRSMDLRTFRITRSLEIAAEATRRIAGLLLVRVRILLRMAWDQFEKEGRLS